MNTKELKQGYYHLSFGEPNYFLYFSQDGSMQKFTFNYSDDFEYQMKQIAAIVKEYAINTIACSSRVCYGLIPMFEKELKENYSVEEKVNWIFI